MKKILIIEENNDYRDNLMEFFEISGYETISSKSGKGGVALAQKNHPDLIVCDVVMAIMDGYDVLNAILEMPLIANTPFIFSSSLAEQCDYEKGITLGADVYLIKPFELVDLLKCIEILLKSGSHRQSKFKTYPFPN